MTAIVLLARASARRHWRGLIVLTLLIGLAGAAVLASAAGARRTSTALDRFREESRAGDVELDLFGASRRQLEEFRHVPAVEGVGVLRMFVLQFPGSEALLFAVGARDASFGNEVDRPRVLEGRLARPTDAREAAISEALASALGKGVGDTVTFDSYTPEQIERTTQGGDAGPPAGPKVPFDIVGIVRRPLDLGDADRTGASVAFMTPGFEARYRDEIGGYVPALLRVRATDGADGVPDLIRSARRIFGDGLFQVVGIGAETAGAADAIDVLTAALWVFAAIAIFAGITAVGIVTFRQIGNEARDQYALAALGSTGRERALGAALPVVPAAVGGAALAVAGAFLISPTLPFGIARQAEPDPGFHADVVVLGIGAVAIIGFVLLVAAVGGRRVASSVSLAQRASGVARPSSASRIASLARATPALTTGARLALEPGRGQLAVPVRTAFLGAAFGTIGIVAVLVFGSSLDHLVSSPRLHGWSWDFSLTGGTPPEQGDSPVCGDLTSPASDDPAFVAVAAVCRESLEVDGQPVQAWSFTNLKGSIEPTIIEGRAPSGPDEVALGGELLATTGKQIGDTVQVAGERDRRYRIVGQVVVTPLESIDSDAMAAGATFTGPGLARVFPEITAPNTNVLVRLAPGVDPGDFERTPTGEWQLGDAVGSGPILPVEVARLRQVDRLPLVLAGLLGLLAIVAVGHAVLLATRRRRRELAVLRTIGFTSRQVRASIAYQASILTALGLVVGIPLGIAAGRVVWRLVADGLGVAPEFGVPVLAIVVVVFVAMVLANLVAAIAATSAVHDRPAEVLAAE